MHCSLANPIAGVVCDSAGHGVPFAGWIVLTTAIERSLDAARHANAGVLCLLCKI